MSLVRAPTLAPASRGAAFNYLRASCRRVSAEAAPRYLYLRARAKAAEAANDAARGIGATSAELTPGRAPEDKGDFAFACHVLAKELRRPPYEIAREIAESAQTGGLLSFETAGPYLNASIAPSEIAGVGLREILAAGARYGELPPTGTRLLIEHTSANPNGPLHVGRARNPILGDTMVRVMKKAGHHVTAEFYINDIGKQLVTLAWGIEKLADKDLQELPARLEAGGLAKDEIEPLRNLATQGLDRAKPDHELVRYYQAASALARVDAKVESEITAWVQAIEGGNREVLAKVRRDCDRVLEGMKQSLDRLHVRFDRFIHESSFVENGDVTKVVELLKKLPHTREEDGSYFIDLEEFGITGRTARYVFLRADGTTLYATRDVAYHLDKAARCDRGINVLGEDQKLAARQVQIALKLLGSSFQPEGLFYSFVSLPEGKMSTRRGRVVTIDDLLDEAVERARDEVTRRRPELDEGTRASISEAVGVGAVRYNIVRVQPEKGIVFRWQDALNFEGNSAPFVQYAHARACSILRKAGREDLVDEPSNAEAFLENPELLASDAASVRLARTLERLPLVIEECASAVRPHPVATFAQEAASQFNLFYRDIPVIGSGEAEGPRLALVAAVRATLASTLDLLAITPLREM